MIFKLQPAFKDYLWGGEKLKTLYNKQYDGDILAESWELSCNKDGPSRVLGGAYDGKPLADIVGDKKLLGTNCVPFPDFPILVKLIDSKQSLSIQVHPDDAYARRVEGQNGKTEMWHIIDCDPGAYIYYGFNGETTEAQYRRHIGEGTLTSVLRQVFVKPGDTFFIEAGTIHAIGPGIVLVEVQQNSNVTYRVFDYGRKDKNGNTRELHIDKAVDVTKREPAAHMQSDAEDLLCACDKFIVRRFAAADKYTGEADDSSFHHIQILHGECDIVTGDTRLACRKGDSVFAAAGTGPYEILGKCGGIITTIPAK